MYTNKEGCDMQGKDGKMSPVQAAAMRRMPQMVIALHIGHAPEGEEEEGFSGESEPSEHDIEDLGKLASKMIDAHDAGEVEEGDNQPEPRYPPTKPKGSLKKDPAEPAPKMPA